MALKCNKSSDWNSASPACRILLLIPEAPEDLSGKSFLIWLVSSSRVKCRHGMGVWCGSGRLCFTQEISFASF